MSESVDILIKADDQASQQLATASTNITASLKRVESIMDSLKDPAERYAEQLLELERLHESGAMSTEQFIIAEEALETQLAKTNTALEESGNKGKQFAGFVGQLATLSGSSEIKGLAGQVSTISDQIEKLGEVSKAGKFGALAFKAGLVALVATVGAKLGQALGDVIFQTKKFEREMQRAKDAANDLNDRVSALQSDIFAGAKTDIELIRDPEKKKAAYAELLTTLNRDLDAVNKNVQASEKLVEEWAGKWKVTGNRKEFEQQAKDQLEIDKERLKSVRAQRDEILKLTGAREAERAAIRARNEEEEKSESFIAGLREELELLKATKEEQLAITAARNTTAEDRGEAELLMKERDAIIAKQQAEEAAAQARLSAEEASDKFIEGLRREIEMLQATKEEQLALEAARNTTAEDRGEAERLLRERDAIQAKLDAEKEAEHERQRMREAALKAEEDARAAEQEKLKSIQEVIAKEQERLKLKELEITKGKEAANVFALERAGADTETAKSIAQKEETRAADLMKEGLTETDAREIAAKEVEHILSLLGQGVDKDLAQQLAAKEATLDAQQKQQQIKTEEEKPAVAQRETAPLQASESRLLTSGSGNSQLDKQVQLLQAVDAAMRMLNETNKTQLAEQRRIAENTAKNTPMVLVQ